MYIEYNYPTYFLLAEQNVLELEKKIKYGTRRIIIKIIIKENVANKPKKTLLRLFA